MYNVTLNPHNIIEVVYGGALEVEEYAKADFEVSRLLDNFPNREGLVLIDISGLTTNTNAGRKAAIATAKTMSNCIVAFFTPNIVNRTLTKIIVASAGRTGIDRVFSKKDDAMNWLESQRVEFQK